MLWAAIACRWMLLHNPSMSKPRRAILQPFLGSPVQIHWFSKNVQANLSSPAVEHGNYIDRFAIFQRFQKPPTISHQYQPTPKQSKHKQALKSSNTQKEQSPNTSDIWHISDAMDAMGAFGGGRCHCQESWTLPAKSCLGSVPCRIHPASGKVHRHERPIAVIHFSSFITKYISFYTYIFINIHYICVCWLLCIC